MRRARRQVSGFPNDTVIWRGGLEGQSPSNSTAAKARLEQILSG